MTKQTRRRRLPGKHSGKRSRKRIPEAILTAFSLFTVIPMPHIPWETENLRYLLCAFPLTGIAVGFCRFAWGELCTGAGLSNILRGAGWCLIPVLLTGGIHLDGYADTSDALASHGTSAHRREILHDPHCGAFAIIHLCVYFTAYFALCASLTEDSPVMPWTFILSRTLSGLSLTLFPLSGEGMAHTFVPATSKVPARLVLTFETLLAMAVICAADAFTGIFVIAAALLTFAVYAHTVRRSFGYVSGDLAGWFLQKAEFWMLAAVIMVQYLRR